MKEIDLQTLKRVQIEILDQISIFCKENEISYWLDCGTLLGAVRHKGYIPWDDDLDIGMLRKDFDKFRALFNSKNERYQFVCGEDNKDFFGAFGKVMDTNTVLYEPDITGYKFCVNIDVFVYDNAPSDAKELKKMYDKRDLYRTLSIYQSMACVEKDDKRSIVIIKHLIHWFLNRFPQGFFMNKQVNNARKYEYSSSNTVGNFTSFSRTSCSIEAFSHTIPIEFEGKIYSAPLGWDEWLCALYNNYMELPPEEKRVSNHEFVAYLDD